MAFSTANKLNDEQLVEEIVKNNNSNLFGILYDRYSSAVYSKCLGFVTSKEEAQDLTHDIFVKLFVKLKTFKGSSKLSTWIYAFTYNHCVNYLQREQKKQKNTHSINEQINNDAVKEVSDEEILELKSEKLVLSLQRIAPEEKALLLMKYQDDLSIKEIAKLNELGESAVKMRLSRAKSHLINIYNNL